VDELLEVQRAYTLNNLICAANILMGDGTAEGKRRGLRWFVRSVQMLDEIETLVKILSQLKQKASPD
jgi:hypothetical protein